MSKMHQNELVWFIIPFVAALLLTMYLYEKYLAANKTFCSHYIQAMFFTVVGLVVNQSQLAKRFGGTCLCCLVNFAINEADHSGLTRMTQKPWQKIHLVAWYQI